MKKKICALIIITFCFVLCLTSYAQAVGTPSIWDMKALSATPKSYTVEVPCLDGYGPVEGVKPIWIEGDTF